MIELLRKKRNRDELAKIHPAFRDRFEDVLASLEADGDRPRLQETFRSAAEQAKKLAEGKSLVKISAHMNTIQGRPASMATHFLNDNAPLADDPHWYALVAVVGAKFHLQSGVVWAARADSPLSPGKPHRIALEAAIAAQDVILTEKLLRQARGFDPVHLEVPGWRRYWEAL